MALVLADRVRDTTTTTGTGTVTLSGTAPTGYQNFSVIGNANTTYYTINAGSQWEVGIGTYSSTGPTLARTTVLESSNANALVNFSAGTKDVFVTYPSDRAVTTDGVETLTNKTINGSNNTITNVSLTTAVTGTLPVANGGTGVTTSTGTTSVVLSNSPVLVTPTLGAASATSIANGLGAVGTPSYAFTGDLNTGMWSPGTDTVAFSTNGAERMRLDSSGNVGIGTTAPATRLHVAGTGSGPTLRLENQTASTGKTYDIISGDGGPLRFQDITAGAERMRIASDGNVGIGTATPGASTRLNVNGRGLFTDGSYDPGDSTASGVSISYDTGSNIGIIGAIQTGVTEREMRMRGNTLTFFTNGANERMRIDSSGNVGIGTSSPASKLSVSGSFDCSGVGKIGTTVAQAAPSTTDIVSTSNSILGGQGGNAIFVGQYPTTFASWIQSSFQNPTTATYNLVLQPLGGNVGIGTTAPVQRLHVRQDQDGTTAALIQNRNGTGSPASALQFISGAFDLSDNRYAMISSAGGSNTTLQFWTGEGAAPAERMRITSAGNVGIGTSAPGAKLDVIGGTVGTTAGNLLNVTIDQGLAGGNAVGIRTNLVRVSNGTDWTTTAMRLQGRVDATNFGYIDLVSGGAQGIAFGSDTSERMRIDSSGNVGIGTSAPAQTLQVLNAGNYQFRLGAGSTFNYDLGRSTSDGLLYFYGNQSTFTGYVFGGVDGERMRITAAGNVGIGTSSPDANAKLDVAGTVRSGAGGSDPGTGAAFYFVGSGSFQTVVAGAAFAVNTGANNARTERMRIDSSGNVGIGTSAPSTRLHAQNVFNGTSVISTFENISNVSANTAAAIDFKADQATTRLTSFRDGAGTSSSFSISPSVAGVITEAVRVTSTGNVGIGTSSPGAKLDVSSSTFNIVASRSTGGYAAFQRIAPAGQWTYDFYTINGVEAARITVTDTNIMAFANGSAATERMRIDASGNVGIGTSAPNYKLDVNGTGYFNSSVQFFPQDGFRFTSASAVSAMRFGSATTSEGTAEWAYSRSGGFAALSIGSTGSALTEIMRAQSDGNVGIGTSSPGTKLDVVGDIRCTNSMFLGAGQNLDNKIEIGSGRTGSNYAYIDLIGDTTYTDYGLRLIRGNGGANTTSQLVHRGTGDMYITTQDAATMYFQTNSTTRMYIEAGGTLQMNGALLVGRSSASTDVNTANDTGSFSVRGNGTTIASMSFHRTGAYAINMGLGTDNVFRIGGWSASSNCFQMDGSGNLTMLGNVTAYSDARIKKDVETIDSALDLVSKMRGVRYTRIDTKKRGVGVIAQEMLEVCPEVVQQGVGDDDTLSVAYGNLVGVLIEAVKELTARVAELEGK